MPRSPFPPNRDDAALECDSAFLAARAFEAAANRCRGVFLGIVGGEAGLKNNYFVIAYVKKKKIRLRPIWRLVPK